MSEFSVEVVRLGRIDKHPNADTLSITQVFGGYPVIVRTGEFNEGDLAVYIPVDSIVPDEERWAFLAGHRRIKAKRLRGIFSMGLLTAALPEWVESQNVQGELGITKYEPGIDVGMSTENEPDPGFLPVYTDIEGLRKHKGVLVEGEEVVCTEKIHGANGRWLFRDGRLWVGSHKCIKREDDANMWWNVARQYQLADILAQHEHIAIYGEVYGQVQDLKYGVTGFALALFDALDTRSRRYFDADEFAAFAAQLGIPTVPVLYRGPWHLPLMTTLGEGPTTLQAAHVREGFVVRPIRERVEHMGRVILKHIGEGYHLRKEGK